MKRNFGSNITLEDKNDPYTMACFLFWANLKQGEKFKIGTKEIEYINTRELNSKNRGKLTNECWTHKIKLNVSSFDKKKQTTISTTKYLYVFRNSEILGSLGRGVDWIENVFRDIEGIIIVDKINSNNLFHNESFFSKVCKRDEVFLEYITA